jgi:putative membrane protein
VIYLTTLPNFLLYFVVSIVLTAIYLRIYMWVTPYDELGLIRAGNTAAAISLSGAGLGFVIPLASVIAHSFSIVDMLVWGVVAMIIQLLTFLAARWLKPQLVADINAGKPASATSLAGMSTGVGILNAACMTF